MTRPEILESATHRCKTPCGNCYFSLPSISDAVGFRGRGMTSTERTIMKLKARAQGKGRMPSIQSIADMLKDLGIPYTIRDSVNVVERRTPGKRYVNSRHDGKRGRRLVVGNLTLDSADSYYSFSTGFLARDLLATVERAGHPLSKGDTE